MTLEIPKNMPAKLIRRSFTPLWPLLLTILLVVGFISAAVYHIFLQPIPNHWDDGVYAANTYVWLDFIETRGDLLRGVFWGAIYQIPRHLPPMVFFTSLLGALVGGETILSMRLAQLVWFFLLLLSAYGIGYRLGGRWAGPLSVFSVGIVPLIFLWTKTIMGEPSLFASIGLLLFVLIYFGNRPNFISGIIIGSAVGFGMLTKQQFPVSAVGPIVLWGLWLAVQFFKIRTERKIIIHTLIGSAMSLILIAGPWYVWNYQYMLSYATQPPFPLHSLRYLPFFSGVFLYLRVLTSSTGWPLLLVGMISLIWACNRVSKNFNRLFQDWNTFAIAMIISSCLVNLIVGGGFRNINVRFITPGFVSLAILAGLALNEAWLFVKCRWAVIGAIILEMVFWWSLSFGAKLPQALTIVALDPNLRPINTQMMTLTVQTILGNSIARDPVNLWLVGNYIGFNPPMYWAYAAENKLDWNVRELYAWDEAEDEVSDVVNRADPGDWIAVYVQPRKFDAEGEKLLARLDQPILTALKSAPNYKLVSHSESLERKEELWIFQARED